MKIWKLNLVFAFSAGSVLLIIDFLTKFIANARLPFEKTVSTFLPFLYFYRTHNTGYHFLFGPINNHFIWALAGLFFVSFLIFSLARSLVKDDLDHASRTIYTIILSLTIGAMGNVLEILFRGYATDFFIFRPFPWPSNICDQYINAILYIVLPVIIIKSIIDHRREKRESKLNEPSAD
ncbi:MAG: signal peptidase II [Candidatus Marinimicrobia bacterium]|nr:signal peptidase II [Candidatus Neomarinimicrobiota bacterium]